MGPHARAESRELRGDSWGREIRNSGQQQQQRQKKKQKQCQYGGGEQQQQQQQQQLRQYGGAGSSHSGSMQTPDKSSCSIGTLGSSSSINAVAGWRCRPVATAVV